MKNSLVSIVVPVYNVEKSILKCVHSIINQTYKNLEIILVDDGSTDNSGKICDKLSETDDRILVIHKSNGGLGSARNEGIKYAKGEFVEFVDSDDWIENDTVEYCINLIDKYQKDNIIVQFSIIETNNKKEKVKKQKEEIRVLSREEKISYFMYKATKTDAYFSACRCLYSKALLNSHRFIEGKINEDIAWKYKIVRDCDLFIDSNQIKYYYYQSTGSITTDKLKKKDFDLFDATMELKKLTSQEKNKTVKRLGEAKYARTSLSLLCKIAYYGIDNRLDRTKTINFLQRRLRANVLLLVTSPMKISRRFLAIMFAVNYGATEKTIHLIKRLV